MTRFVLVDTGPLVALRNSRDQHRERVEQLAQGLPEQLLTCWPVLTEAAYLLREHPREVQVLLDSARTGLLSILSLTAMDAAPIARIMDKYADHSFSLADASLMHLAEREGIKEIFTLDEKDFSQFRSSLGTSLTLIT